MKTVVYEKYGNPDVLTLRNVAKPVPNDDELLIKIHATTVTAADCRLRKADPFLARLFSGLIRPARIKVLGFELSGMVEETGKNVRLFKKGDLVFASTGIRFGAYAEYICLPEDGTIALKPANMSFEEAAAVPIGGGSALRFLRKGNIQHGQKVCIYGASGSVGTFAVQLAKHMGAEVTGVCSAANAEMVASLGADKVFDYAKEDFAKGSGTYDIIMDTVGKSPFAACVRLLKEDGIYLRVVHMGLPVLRGLLVSMTSKKKVIAKTEREEAENLTFLKELIEAGKIRSVIDRQYSLEQISQAHTYVDTGRKKGNVVILI